MSRRNRDRILTMTANKMIVRDGELHQIFTHTELQQWHDLINKIRLFDEKHSNQKEESK